MGWNTTIVVLNDALDRIRDDREIGKRIADAVERQHGSDARIDIPAGNHCNAMTVIESHHADWLVAVAVGGNSGHVLGHAGGYSASAEESLRALADAMGYRLVKRGRRTKGQTP